MKSPTELPQGLEPYRRTQVFSETTVPKGLLNEHTTKEGTWGLIQVLEGELLYEITDPRREPASRMITPDAAPGVVEPTILHKVRPLGGVRFFVEFYRKAV